MIRTFFLCLCDGCPVQIFSKHKKIGFFWCFVEHLDPNPILFRTSFQKTKNLEKTFTLISGCWETLKHANLIDFRGNCQVFIKESICKTLFLNFLKKVRIFLYLCFLQNLTNSTKKFTFFKFGQKVIILMKIGSAQCFHFWKSSKLTEFEHFDSSPIGHRLSLIRLPVPHLHKSKP